MRSAARRGVLGLLALGALGGCGFRPLYGSGAPAARMQGRVEVAPIDGAAGFALRERLTARLGAASAPTHRLEVVLILAQEGVAITRENITTRFNVTGVAEYRLEALDSAGRTVEGSVRAITGYSAPDTETASAFATLAAARDAEERLARTLAERMVQRLALRAGEWVS